MYLDEAQGGAGRQKQKGLVLASAARGCSSSDSVSEGSSTGRAEGRNELKKDGRMDDKHKLRDAQG